MLRATLLSLALTVPNIAAAVCNGPSFLDALSTAQQAELEELAQATPYARGNAWYATKDDTVLTLVGTMHLPDPRHAQILQRVQGALASADLLLVEATLEDQAALQAHMARNPDLMTLPSDTSLPELLDEETWNDVRAAAEARGMPGFLAAKMQPWFLSLSLAIPPCAMAAMTTGEGGLDNMLIEAALDMDIPVKALEPWERMFALLAGGTFEEQIDALRMGLVDADLQDSMVVALTEFYFAEQSAMGWYISAYIKPYLPPSAAATFDQQMTQLEQQLLLDRNADWIPVITQAATENERIVVAFGAAHLFGEKGVLNLLEQDGWTLTSF